MRSVAPKHIGNSAEGKQGRARHASLRLATNYSASDSSADAHRQISKSAASSNSLSASDAHRLSETPLSSKRLRVDSNIGFAIPSS
eukprot:6172350-Pleurochrysis_carterae.AAC.1